MKKVMFGMAVAMVAISVIAEQTNSVPTPEEKASRRERIMKNTGGIIFKQGEGKIVFVDCQSKIAHDEVVQRINKFEAVLKFKCEIVKGGWKFGDQKPSDAPIYIYIVDDAALPMSLIAPEAGWGVVNTFHLTSGMRFSMELTRVFTLTAGAARSTTKTSSLQKVTCPEDLDKLKTDGFTVDMVQAIRGNLHDLGMTPARMSSYKRAVQEGWAPAPTNEYQKAIWDQVRSIPTNPIRIEKK